MVKRTTKSSTAVLSYFESFNTGALSRQHLCFGHGDDIKISTASWGRKFPQAGFPWNLQEQLTPPEMSITERATHAHKLPSNALGGGIWRLNKVPAASNQSCTSKPANKHSEQQFLPPAMVQVDHRNNTRGSKSQAHSQPHPANGRAGWPAISGDHHLLMQVQSGQPQASLGQGVLRLHQDPFSRTGPVVIDPIPSRTPPAEASQEDATGATSGDGQPGRVVLYAATFNRCMGNCTRVGLEADWRNTPNNRA